MDNVYPPFPNDTGALIVPRQLVRWLDVNPQGGALRRCMMYLQLPAFTTTQVWEGASQIVASFNCEAPNNFSLRLGYTMPLAPNYVLCIAYLKNNTMTRYRLWGSANIGVPNVQYTGQPILKNFRFEVWNTNAGPAAEAGQWSLYTSVLQPIDYRYGVDTVLKSADPLNTSFYCINPQSVAPTIGTAVDYWKPSGMLFDGGGNLTAWTGGGGMSVTFGSATQRTNPTGVNLSAGTLTLTLVSSTTNVKYLYIIVKAASTDSGNLSLCKADNTDVNDITFQLLSGVFKAIFSNVQIQMPYGYPAGIALEANGSYFNLTTYDVKGNVVATGTTNTIRDLSQIASLQNVGLFNTLYEVIVSTAAINFGAYIAGTYGNGLIPMPMTFPAASIPTTN